MEKPFSASAIVSPKETVVTPYKPLTTLFLIVLPSLFLTARGLPSDEKLLNNFYSHERRYEELHELIDNTYQGRKLHISSLGDRLKASPRYADLLEQIGISYLSFRSNPTDTRLPLAIFFELAESKEVLRFNFGTSKGVVIYPGGPPLNYRRRVVLNIDKANYWHFHKRLSQVPLQNVRAGQQNLN